MVILVVGSTGFVGGDIALKLKQRGHKVLALARGGRLHPKSQRLLDAGVEVLDGDLTRPTHSLRLAPAWKRLSPLPHPCPVAPMTAFVASITTALLRSSTPRRVREFAASSTSPIRATSTKIAVRHGETRLRDALAYGSDGSRHPTALVLHGSLAQLRLGFDALGGSARICGSGEAKVSYISAFDVADFVVAAATKTYPQKNVVLEIGGPQPLSQLDAVLLSSGPSARRLSRTIFLSKPSVHSINPRIRSKRRLPRSCSVMPPEMSSTTPSPTHWYMASGSHPSPILLWLPRKCHCSWLLSPRFFLTSPATELRPHKRLDPVLSRQAQAQQLPFVFHVNVKIKKRQHLLSAPTQSASSASDTSAGLN